MIDTLSGEVILGAMDDIVLYGPGSHGEHLLPLPASFVEVSNFYVI
jgi:hypothetical protein